MDELYQKILDENIKLHRVEAKYYEALHPEEFNWFEQGRIWHDLKFIRKQLSINCSALDLGCGTGNISLKLLSLSFEVLGVDISKEMLEILEKRIPEKFKPKISLVSKNIDEFLDTCVENFDLVTMSSILHHLPEYVQTFKRAMSLVKQGGWLYVTHEPTKHALSPDRFLRKILWQLDSPIYLILNFNRIPQTEARSYRISDYHLYHGLDEERVLFECDTSGFKVIRFERYSSSMRLGLSCFIDSNLLKSERNFCLIAQKIKT